MTEFSDDTAIESTGPSTFTATITDRWNVGSGANGGYMAAIAARAILAAEPADERPIRSLTAHYLRPPTPGPVDIDIAPVRIGRSVSVLDATIEREGTKLVVARAAVANVRPNENPALSYNDRTAPDFPAPSELPREVMAGGPNLRSRFETHYVAGGERAASEKSVSHGWIRTTDHAPIDAPFAVGLTDFFVPPHLFRIGSHESMISTIDLTVHLFDTFEQPIDGWAAVTNHSTVSSDGYVETETEVWSEQGKLLAQGRQLSVLIT